MPNFSGVDIVDYLKKEKLVNSKNIVSGGQPKYKTKKKCKTIYGRRIIEGTVVKLNAEVSSNRCHNCSYSNNN